MHEIWTCLSAEFENPSLNPWCTHKHISSSIFELGHEETATALPSDVQNFSKAKSENLGSAWGDTSTSSSFDFSSELQRVRVAESQSCILKPLSAGCWKLRSTFYLRCLVCFLDFSSMQIRYLPLWVSGSEVSGLLLLDLDSGKPTSCSTQRFSEDCGVAHNNISRYLHASGRRQLLGNLQQCFHYQECSACFCVLWKTNSVKIERIFSKDSLCKIF